MSCSYSLRLGAQAGLRLLSRRKITFVATTTSIRFAVCILSLLSLGVTAEAQQATEHAHVELLSRQDSVVPGSTLQLGVHFVLEPGWHIYWTNPGDSGQPPAFQWQLPTGFSAGEILWPRPERMQPVKELADYGYRDDVLFIVPIHVPRSMISAGQAAMPFVVDVKWLICREVCLPEHARLQLEVPQASRAKVSPSSAKLFADAEKRLPKPLPHNWNASVTSTKDDFVLSILAGNRITEAEFFPLDPGQIDNPAPQKTQPSVTGIKITLKKSDLLLKPITILRGVLAIPGKPAYRIEAPVRQPIQ
jgi:DsbC/DsbD-like thiol-disulfide interchange protein